MKKIVALLCACLLVGCSQQEESGKVVCKQEADDMKTTITLNAKGDVVNTQIQEKVTNLSFFEEIGIDKDGLKEKAEEVKKQYAAYKGIEYQYEIQENSIVETFEITYDKENFEDLIELQLIIPDDESGKVDFISLEKTVEGFESDGFTCK